MVLLIYKPDYLQTISCYRSYLAHLQSK